jgi:hypothetical protein
VQFVIAALAILILGLGFTAFTGAPYVPSKRRDIERAFTKLYKLSSKDTLVDMGSGDGVVLRMARRYGATAVGYEISPLLVLLSRLLARGDGKQKIISKSYWSANFPSATTVIYTFGDNRDIAKMYQKGQSEATRLGKTINFITYGFAVPGIEATSKSGAHFLYTIPALAKKQ